MNQNPLKPNDIVNKLRDLLDDYVRHESGILSLAKDAFDVIAVLGESTPRFRVILLWDGDEDATGQPLAGIVHHNLSVVISHNRGLRLWRGENLSVDTAAQKSLLTLVDEIRARIRAYSFPEEITSERFLYLGCTPEITPDGLPLDAYRMRFRLTATLPFIPAQ